MSRPRPRPELGSLTPYRTSGTGSGHIFLHANENPYPPPAEVVAEIFETALAHPLNRYPNAEPTELVAELASYVGIDPSWIWIGDGANEVLLQACLAYGGPGRTSLHFEPSYVMHQRQSRMAGTNVAELGRVSDFAIDVDAVVESMEALRPDVVVVCTPNNPTGTVTPRDALRRIAEAAPGLVVIDEAYFEFCGETFLTELGDYPNVLIVRTLSKAFRLASVRLGYGIAHPDLLEEMRRVRMPYGQSAFTQAAATVAVKRRDELLDAVPKIVAERERLAEVLAGTEGVRVYPSGANFILFKHPAPDALLAALADRGVVIRDFRDLPGCEDCLRVTVGTPEENDAFLSALGVSAPGH